MKLVFFFLKFIYLFNLFLIFFWLHWVFVAVCGLSLVEASRGYFLLRCAGFLLRWLLLLWSMSSRRMDFSNCGSWALECSLSSCARAYSCSAACGIFPDQGSNPCPLHWQVDYQPLRHQGRPRNLYSWVGLLIWSFVKHSASVPL